jgi:hypothetical protein
MKGLVITTTSTVKTLITTDTWDGRRRRGKVGRRFRNIRRRGKEITGRIFLLQLSNALVEDRDAEDGVVVVDADGGGSRRETGEAVVAQPAVDAGRNALLQPV